MSHKKHPVIILGGGPAGSATAMNLLGRGITPVIVERDDHPRYHVGESLTGATALSLKDLGLGSAIEAQNYPIKHGAVFYGPDGKNDFWVGLVRRDENNKQVPNITWNVMRSTFDAIAIGMMPNRTMSFSKRLRSIRRTAPAEKAAKVIIILRPLHASTTPSLTSSMRIRLPSRMAGCPSVCNRKVLHTVAATLSG